MKLNLIPTNRFLKNHKKIIVGEEEFDHFKACLINLHEHIDREESEENQKNLVRDFLRDSFYKGEYEVNTKDKKDLVIHHRKTNESDVAVIIEVKRPKNIGEMISDTDINKKALHELVLYYLREKKGDNDNMTHMIITNVNEWFVFRAEDFNRVFCGNKKFLKKFNDFEDHKLDFHDTPSFYEKIAKEYIESSSTELPAARFDLQKIFGAGNKKDENISKELVPLYKLLSPQFLLNLSIKNDSNYLDKGFYDELLHIIGLEEVKEGKGSKKIIRRKEEGNRNPGSLLENALYIMERDDYRLRNLDNRQQYGTNSAEQSYNVALELCITWINRVLFLKLLEAQLVTFHQGSKDYIFLDAEFVPNYDSLDELFFQALAKRPTDRPQMVRDKYKNIPYLNSSLFEPTDAEKKVLKVTSLNNDFKLDIITKTILQENNGKHSCGELDTLTYLFKFLDSYNFASVDEAEVQLESKSLINASVLGLIFEKINGYKDGSFFTPGFITMYMCRETIRRSVVQKFNEVKGWNCQEFKYLKEDIKRSINEGDREVLRKEANKIINSLKICDPAVGSGHFLVSALNEIIAIKNDLGLLTSENGDLLTEDYSFEVENDELVVTNRNNDKKFIYRQKDEKSSTIQKTLFQEKKTIIENCLFGVDINPNSVKICQLRLWIELLKNAYYKDDGQLETLPNIDINIKCGNSLISRFDLDASLGIVLKKSGRTITEYRNAVFDYKEARTKDVKEEMATLINSIKSELQTEIARTSADQKKFDRLSSEYHQKFETPKLLDVELTTKQKKTQETIRKKLKKDLEGITAKIADIKNNVIYKNAFEWRFEFPEILNDDGKFVGFDTVIGNPPYIRQEELKEFKSQFKTVFTTYSGTADIYVFFIERGFSIMKEHGLFTYIMPNKFMQAGYGQGARHFLLDNNLVEILDFGDLQVFDEATTYPCILTASKSAPSDSIYTIPIDTLDYPTGFSDYVLNTRNEIAQSSLTDETWVVSNAGDQALLDKIKQGSKPLELFLEGEANYGIKTGLSEAFFIDDNQKELFIAQDAKNENVIKPLIQGRDLQPYISVIPKKHLLFIPWHFPLHKEKDIIGASEKATTEFENNYPYIFQHLEKYKDKLLARNQAETGIRYEWYAMQRYAASYYQEFEKPKIMYQVFQVKPCFVYDDNGYYCNNSMWFIPTDDKALLGILNSKMGWWLISKYCTQIQNGYQLIWKYFSQIPIVSANEEQSTQITEKVEEIIGLKKSDASTDTKIQEAEIDQLVYELYGLTDDEIMIIERQ